MALRVAAPRSLRRLFSTSSFFHPPTVAAATAAAQPRAEPEPNTNLFVSARVVSDRISGYSKGFGFVRYATLEDAAKGIEGMNGKYLDGWVIFAEYARPRPPPTSPQDNGFPSYGHQ
ncbi:hypothetical protein BT93_F2785 [Corymbia citriodora subsp. variegata]|nr:hypothetical protein BT93_F2785 [Corymbia citriodora subsp. variegata]KAF8026075.1 hypothetical protein BT93_F2785 [Corymbia citriodora subsp. variegata]